MDVSPIGMQVVNIEQGEFLGRVQDVLLDESGNALFLVLAGRNWYDCARVCKWVATQNNMFAVREDYELPSVPLAVQHAAHKLTTMPVFTQSGTFLGYANGILTDEQGRQTRLLLPQGEFTLYLTGKDMLLVQDTDAPYQPQPEMIFLQETPVLQTDDLPPPAQTPPVQNPSASPKAPPVQGDLQTPAASAPPPAEAVFGVRNIANQAAFLVGKRSAKTVMGAKEALVKPGQIITEHMIERAVAEGKIAELMMCLHA